jgi:hypothetical protein
MLKELRALGRGHIRRAGDARHNVRNRRAQPANGRKIVRDVRSLHDERGHGRQPVKRLSLATQRTPGNDAIATRWAELFLFVFTARAPRVITATRDVFLTTRRLRSHGHLARTVRAIVIVMLMPRRFDSQPAQVDSSVLGRSNRIIGRTNVVFSRPIESFGKRKATARTPALLRRRAPARMARARISLAGCYMSAGGQRNASRRYGINRKKRGANRAASKENRSQKMANAARHGLNNGAIAHESRLVASPEMVNLHGFSAVFSAFYSPLSVRQRQRFTILVVIEQVAKTCPCHERVE